MSKINNNTQKLAEYTCSILGGRTTNEDTKSIAHFELEKYGSCLHYGIYDGHSGKIVSNIISKKFHKIFVTFLKELIDKSMLEYEKIIIQAFKLTNQKIIKEIEKMFVDSGSTIITLYYFKKFNKVFVFNLGDSRFICYNETGTIEKNLIKTIDFEDDSVFEYEYGTKEGKNNLHYFPYAPKLKEGCEELKVSEKYNKGDIQNNYYFEQDNDFLLKEWELLLLNKKSNPNGLFRKLTTNSDNSIRFGNLQPSRSMESSFFKKCLKNGMVHVFEIKNDDTSFFIGCDGFEDGKSLNEYEIVKFLCEPQMNESKIMSCKLIQHIKHEYWKKPSNKHLLGTMNPDELNSDMNSIEIITWLKENFCTNPTVRMNIPYDWKRGFSEAVFYFFDNIKDNKINFEGNKILNLAQLAILYGSSDNISGICAELIKKKAESK